MHRAKARNRPRNSAVSPAVKIRYWTGLTGAASEAGRVKDRAPKRGRAESPSTGAHHHRGGGGVRKVYGSETQHLPNMKSGTRITRSSRGEARRGSWKPETWNRGCDEGREKIERERGTQKGGETHRSRGQEILDLRDAYSQYGVHDFRSIPVPRRRVLCINSANERQVNRRMQSLECICEWDHAEINLREE